MLILSEVIMLHLVEVLSLTMPHHGIILQSELIRLPIIYYDSIILQSDLMYSIPISLVIAILLWVTGHSTITQQESPIRQLDNKHSGIILPEIIMLQWDYILLRIILAENPV